MRQARGEKRVRPHARVLQAELKASFEGYRGGPRQITHTVGRADQCDAEALA